MKDQEYERICAIALEAAFGYEPRIATGIIRELGSGGAFFGLSEKERMNVVGPYSKYREGCTDRALERAQMEFRSLESSGLRFIHCREKEFPELLKDCEDCPVGLYVRSSADLADIFDGSPFVSIIGTRDISPYGLEWTRRIVEALSRAPQKPKIVSGLAIGVDITAHNAALDFGLATVGVLPTGIDGVYPRSHIPAASRISAAPGSALVTDFPPGTQPVAATFLRRNRIIAGMSQSTILVESKIKGGGMMTSRLAGGYGRTVLALPGRIDDSRSAGCNALIAEKVAEAIGDLDRLGEVLGLGEFSRRMKAELEEEVRAFYRGGDGRKEDEARDMSLLALAIKKNRGVDSDGLCQVTGIALPRLCAMLTTLECDGFICRDLLGRCSIRVR